MEQTNADAEVVYAPGDKAAMAPNVSGPPASSINVKLLNIIAEHVKRREIILFLGAGVNYPPPDGSPYSYPEEKRPPLGTALSLDLAAGCNFAANINPKEVENLQRVSQHYESVYGRSMLVNDVKARVSHGKEPSPILRGLADMDFPLIISTNYDRLFEAALEKAGKTPRADLTSIYSPYSTKKTVDVRTLPGKGDPPFIVKIHGDVTIPESIVITDEDYIQFVMRMGDKEQFHPIPKVFRTHFLEWPTLFIGYSLKDYNLRLLFRTLRWQKDEAVFPATYSVDFKPDPLIFDVWHQRRRYVQFISQDVWAFVPDLYRLVMQKEMPL
jgi:hypothetical protein